MSKPTWIGDYGPDYETMVRSWGPTVLNFETFGSYQGDHLALLASGDRVGLVVFGYGSCSGCDELEAISPSHWACDDDSCTCDWGPVEELSRRLAGSVHWEDSREALAEWVNSSPENHWWSYDEEIANWLDRELGTTLIEDRGAER